MVVSIGWFQIFIEEMVGNHHFHPFKTGCLGYQAGEYMKPPQQKTLAIFYPTPPPVQLMPRIDEKKSINATSDTDESKAGHAKPCTWRFCAQEFRGHETENLGSVFSPWKVMVKLEEDPGFFLGTVSPYLLSSSSPWKRSWNFS